MIFTFTLPILLLHRTVAGIFGVIGEIDDSLARLER